MVDTAFDKPIEILPQEIEQNENGFLDNKLHRTVELMHILCASRGFVTNAGFRLLNNIEDFQTIQKARIREQDSLADHWRHLEDIERTAFLRSHPFASLQELAICTVRERLGFDLSAKVSMLGALPDSLKRALLLEDALHVPHLDGLEEALSAPLDVNRRSYTPDPFDINMFDAPDYDWNSDLDEDDYDEYPFFFEHHLIGSDDEI